VVGSQLAVRPARLSLSDRGLRGFLSFPWKEFLPPSAPCADRCSMMWPKMPTPVSEVVLPFQLWRN
jgi:hypothetical protein